MLLVFFTPYLYADLLIESCPTSAQLVYNEALDLEVKISGLTTPMAGFEIEISYNADFLLLSQGSFSQGSFLSDLGETQWFIRGSEGSYTVSCAILGGTAGAIGSGTLFRINLSALEQDTGIVGSDLNMPEIILKTPSNQYIIPDEVNGCNIQVAASYPETQVIQLSEGWNLVSAYVVPEDYSIEQVFADLIQSNHLIKVQDEEGRAFEKNLLGDWINEIGDFLKTEGYGVKVSSDCELNLTGCRIPLPFSIPLSNGWNSISYPYHTIQSAMSLLQHLIDANQLVKVQDETGAAIEKSIGGDWLDNIVNLLPGEGYDIFVNADTHFIYPAPAPSGSKSILNINE